MKILPQLFSCRKILTSVRIKDHVQIKELQYAVYEVYSFEETNKIDFSLPFVL